MAYEPANKALVEALHTRLLRDWNNGLGAPPAVPPPPPPPPKQPAGPHVRWRHGSDCLTSVDGEGCGHPQCDGLAMRPCASKAAGSTWQEVHTAEPTQIQAVSGPAGCLNLYGGGRSSENCSAGTGVHRTDCGKRMGNRFQWVPESRQIAFGEGAAGMCTELCVAPQGGCVVVQPCGSSQSKGWEREVQ